MEAAWRTSELALLEEGQITYVSVAPSCPKGELHMPTALGEHPKPSAGWKRGLGAVLPKASMKKDQGMVGFLT